MERTLLAPSKGTELKQHQKEFQMVSPVDNCKQESGKEDSCAHPHFSPFIDSEGREWGVRFRRG